MSIDNHSVQGNATLFNGSVVETKQATADLRLANGIEITMSTESRGTLFLDHLVLQQGESEFAAPTTFQIEVNDLRVTPNEPSSRGLVSLRPGKIVEVASLAGSFRVASDKGILLGNVRLGQAISFVMKDRVYIQTGVGKATQFPRKNNIPDPIGR
jgi:hypothetical protein